MVRETTYTETFQYKKSRDQPDDLDNFLSAAWLDTKPRKTFIFDRQQEEEVIVNDSDQDQQNQQIQKYLPAIGSKLGCFYPLWYCFCYFAISPGIIVTCAHNIYCEQKKKYANSIIFVPGVDKRLTKRSKIYESVQEKYFKTIQPDQQTFRDCPKVNELCLISLSQRLQLQHYIKIKSLEAMQPGLQLLNVGYPMQNPEQNANRWPKRKILKGSLLKTQGCIVFHNMPTKVGHSGSPILRLQQGQVFAIGIHTHRGTNDKYKQGLLFNKEVFEKQCQFQKKIRKQFDLSDTQSQLSKSLCFNNLSQLQNDSQQSSRLERLCFGSENSVLLLQLQEMDQI